METTESKSGKPGFVETTLDSPSLSSNRQNHCRYSQFFTKYFGNKQFVYTFWKLLFPSLIWGFITSLVPLLFNVLCAYAKFSLGQGFNGNAYLAINYTYGIFTTFNSLITVFLFAVLPAIGNFIGRGHYKMMRQTVRWAIYIGFIVALILMIFEQAFAKDMMNLMVWSNEPTGNQTQLSVILLRFLSFIGFFYLWSWIYVPTLGSVKNTKVIFTSSFVAFCFFIIVTPLFLHFTNDSMDQAFYGLGAIYLIYFMIQPIYLYIYCKFIKTWRSIWYKCFSFYYQKHQELIRNDHVEIELLFMDHWNVSFQLVKRIFKLSWCIILDQSVYAIVTIIQTVFIINYGGKFITGANFNLNGANTYAAAANYYKDITSIPFMLNTFMYGIFNAFTIAPQYFVANELGKGNKELAYHNEFLCANWGILLGILFLVVMFICSTTLNETFFPSDNQQWYYIYISNTSNSYVTYSQLYYDNNNIMFIFSGFMIINTLCSMLFFVMIEGGSKWTAVGDSLIQIIFTIIMVIMYSVHYDSMYWYYAVSQIMLLAKVIVCYIIIGTKQALNSIEYHSLDDMAVMFANKQTKQIANKI